MNAPRLVLAGVLTAVIALSSHANAQWIDAPRPGPFEIGAFGQLDRLDKAMLTDRLGVGAGARLGWFFTRAWELEGEASFSRAKPTAARIQTGDVQINYYVGRLNYNRQIHGASAILGVGAGADAVDDHSDLIISPLIGLRLPLSDSWHIRLDALGMLAPNPTSRTYKFPPPPPGATGATVNDGAAYLTNLEARIGLGWLPMSARAIPETLTVRISPSDATLQLLCSRALVTTALNSTVRSNINPSPSQAVTWVSRDPSVATVQNGIVTAVGPGTTRIAASSALNPGVSDVVTVTVNGTGMSMASADTVINRRSMASLDTAVFFATDLPRIAPHRKGMVAADAQKVINLLALTDSARSTLSSWIGYMNKYATDTLTIEGWADKRASHAHNLSLSQRRANAARDYLIDKGIAANRIKAVEGFGETERYGSLGSNRRANVRMGPVVLMDTVITAHAGACTPR